MAKRQILALGGGGFSEEPENPLLDDFLLTLADADTPNICFVPTASGDSESYLLKFYKCFANRKCVPAHLPLFRREHEDLREFVLSQHIIFVGGGNTMNLLAIWRAHGLDKVLVEAYESGVILAGVSAGSLCWFQGGITDSCGKNLAAMHDGLGLLAGSNCPHYDSEKQRRPIYCRAINDGFPGGYAADDGAALHFEENELVEVVTSRASAAAFRVALHDGQVIESSLPTRYLG